MLMKYLLGSGGGGMGKGIGYCCCKGEGGSCPYFELDKGIFGSPLTRKVRTSFNN